MTWLLLGSVLRLSPDRSTDLGGFNLFTEFILLPTELPLRWPLLPVELNSWLLDLLPRFFRCCFLGFNILEPPTIGDLESDGEPCYRSVFTLFCSNLLSRISFYRRRLNYSLPKLRLKWLSELGARRFLFCYRRFKLPIRGCLSGFFSANGKVETELLFVTLFSEGVRCNILKSYFLRHLGLLIDLVLDLERP